MFSKLYNPHFFYFSQTIYKLPHICKNSQTANMYACCPSGKKILLAILAYGKLKTLGALDREHELPYLPKEFLLVYAKHEIRYVYRYLPSYLQNDEDILDCLSCHECSRGQRDVTDTPHMRGWCKARRQQASVTPSTGIKKKPEFPVAESTVTTVELDRLSITESVTATTEASTSSITESTV